MKNKNVLITMLLILCIFPIVADGDPLSATELSMNDFKVKDRINNFFITFGDSPPLQIENILLKTGKLLVSKSNINEKYDVLSYENENIYFEWIRNENTVSYIKINGDKYGTYRDIRVGDSLVKVVDNYPGIRNDENRFLVLEYYITDSNELRSWMIIFEIVDGIVNHIHYSIPLE